METFSALLAICAGNSPVPGEFPAQRPVARSFEVFFDLRLNKRLSKQSGDLRRYRAHYDVTVMNTEIDRVIPNLLIGQPTVLYDHMNVYLFYNLVLRFTYFLQAWDEYKSLYHQFQIIARIYKDMNTTNPRYNAFSIALADCPHKGS